MGSARSGELTSKRLRPAAARVGTTSGSSSTTRRRSSWRDVSRHFGLHELAVEDAATAHQRPKVEAYDDFHFIVYRTARYDAEHRQVIFGELDLFLGVGFVIAVRHDEAGDYERARRRLEQYPHLARTGPAAAVWAILDVVVDDYEPVVNGLESDIEETERAIFSGREDLTERIYELKQEITDFYRAVHPLLPPLDALERGLFAPIDRSLLRYFRDLHDHVRRIDEELLASATSSRRRSRRICR